MTLSYTTTGTFTRTHARHLAAKVIADMYECSILYGEPSSTSLASYETELVEMLAEGYVQIYEFGFTRNGACIVGWRYKVASDGSLTGGITDANPGKLYARAKVAGASTYNYMTRSQKWHNLTSSQQDAFVDKLPFTRTPGALPGQGNGYWQADHTYSAGGTRVSRETFRSL